MKNIPNILTSLRIILSVSILFVSAASNVFFFFYISAGMTDMVDGFAARILHAESDFGATLDSIADIVFIVAAMIKLLPIYSLKPWLWYWISVIILIKLFGYVYSFFTAGTVSLPHTTLNRVAGCMLFVFPFVAKHFSFNHFAAAVCLIASVAALQEVVFSIKKPQK